MLNKYIYWATHCLCLYPVLKQEPVAMRHSVIAQLFLLASRFPHFHFLGLTSIKYIVMTLPLASGFAF